MKKELLSECIDEDHSESNGTIKERLKQIEFNSLRVVSRFITVYECQKISS